MESLILQEQSEKYRPCDYAFALKITDLKMNPAGPPIPAVMADLR